MNARPPTTPGQKSPARLDSVYLRIEVYPNRKHAFDGDLLSELWSQPERWWEVWLAPPEVRDQREWLRYRMSLVQMQTSLKNRIHATLHRHGVLHEFSDLFGKKGLVFLKALCQAKSEPVEAGRQLSASGRGTLSGYLKLLGKSAKSDLICKWIARTG